MKYWEIIADNLGKAGWSWGCVSTLDSRGRTIWIAETHRDNAKRFVVRADEKLTAFLELEAAIRDGSLLPLCSCVAITLPASSETRIIATPAACYARAPAQVFGHFSALVL
jgi:hypothetical protein